MTASLHNFTNAGRVRAKVVRLERNWGKKIKNISLRAFCHLQVTSEAWKPVCVSPVKSAQLSCVLPPAMSHSCHSCQRVLTLHLSLHDTLDEIWLAQFTLHPATLPRRMGANCQSPSLQNLLKWFSISRTNCWTKCYGYIHVYIYIYIYIAYWTVLHSVVSSLPNHQTTRCLSLGFSGLSPKPQRPHMATAPKPWSCLQLQTMQVVSAT